MKVAQLIFFSFFLFSFLSAQVIVVGDSGDYSTLSQAGPNLSPGDTVLLQSQIFDGGQFLSGINGTSAQPIVIIAEELHQAIFQGGSTAIQFQKCNHLVIDGIQVSGQTQNGMNIDDGGDFDDPSTYITVRNCVFRDLEANGNNDLLKMSGVDYFTIENCQFINGSQAGGSSGLDFVGCHQGVVQDCLFDRSGTTGMQAKGGAQYIRIQRNIFKNLSERGINLGGSSDLPFFRPPLIYPLQNAFEAADLEVFSNVFIGTQAPIAYVGVVRAKVYNNTFYQPENWVFRILQENTTPGFLTCGDNEFSNNIVYLANDLTEVNIGPNTDPASFTFTNNLWFNASSSSWSPSLPSGASITNRTIANPLFSNASAEDFSLLENSPAIESGFPFVQPTTDFNGEFFNTPPSVGALEFGSVVTPPEPSLCSCSVDEVESNTVAPCTLVVGTVVTVSTATEFRNAINQANAAGGNRTILLEDGVYVVATPGSYPYITGDNIVIRSKSGQRNAVTLRGSGNIPTNGTENGIGVEGNNVTIADLTIRDVGNHGIQVSGANLYVHNVRIQDTYEHMIKGATFAEYIDAGTVQCCLMEYTAGIAQNYYTGGIDVHQGRDWLVRDNVFIDIESPNVTLAEHAVHFWNECSNNTVERNVIVNCDRGIGFGLGTIGSQNVGGIIRNNMIFNDGTGLYDDTGIGLEDSPNTQVYNNTIYIDYPNAIEYRFATTTNVVIANNLTNKAIVSRDGGTGSVFSNETNAVLNWFVNPAAGDMRLSSNIAAVVDQGTNLSAAQVSVDIDQTSRPIGPNFDLGAEEYSDAVTPPEGPDCACTVDEVESNTVTPCTLVIGTVVTVSTATEFRNAINQANGTGGDMTILLEDGDYVVATAGSYPYITGDNIVIRSKSGQRNAVTLRGSGNMPTVGTNNGFGIQGNNVTIADLTIRDVGNHGIQVSGAYLYVHNVRILDTYEQMIKGSTNATSIDYGTVQCCLMEYTAGVAPNFYTGGIDVHKGLEWQVRDNVFKGIASPSGSLAEHAVHFWNNCVNNTVERNVIVNCDRGIGFGLGTNGNQNIGGIIRNNMIYNDGSGVFGDVGIGLESSPNTEVYNNTIHIQYPNAIEYRFGTTTNVVIANNLTNRAIVSRDGGSGNIFSNVSNAQFNWFVNPSAGDLRLASNISSVVDQGSNLSTAQVTDDIDKTSRPVGSSFDVGAHEYLSTVVVLDPDVLLSNDCIELLSQPSVNNFTITGQLSSFTIDIIDINGTLVQNVNSSGTYTTIDLTTLPSGLLFVRIVNNVNGSIALTKILSQ